MIIVRKAADRYRVRHRERGGWLTSSLRGPTALPYDGAAASLLESRLRPGTRAALHLRPDAEIVTYVLAGAIVQGDSTGQASVILAGEFQRRTGAPGVLYGEGNASRTDWAHMFQIWLQAAEAGRAPGQEQKRFSAAERRGVLCVVASPDGRGGSLCIEQDASIYSALVGPGQHLVHELRPWRSAWLHVVLGEVALGTAILAPGDGASVSAERVVAITARRETEVLLVDLSEREDCKNHD